MPDLLPPNATPQERALSLATERPFAVPVRQLWSPYTCPAAQLPWLAWALSVDEWDAAWPESTQRQVIAVSIDQHRKKGTVGALRRALNRLGYEVEIDEATGTAYTFRLRVKVGAGDTAGGAVAEAALAQATAIALRQKNARSDLIGTAYIGDTDPFRIYSGGATVNGIECEIKEPPAPLPLDAYADRMIGSFWTVRMHGDYTGPIGRVQRDSDNAVSDYYSVAELARFVDGTTWSFLKLYAQAGDCFEARNDPLDDPMAGDFDANGIPIVNLNATGKFVARFNQIAGNDFTLSAAVKLPTGSFDNLQFKLWRDSEVASAARVTIYESLIQSRWVPGSSSFNWVTSQASPCCVAAIFDATSIDVRKSSGSSSTSFAAVPSTLMDRLQIAISIDTDSKPFYGGSYWRRKLTTAEADAFIAAVETHLQF